MTKDQEKRLTPLLKKLIMEVKSELKEGKNTIDSNILSHVESIERLCIWLKDPNRNNGIGDAKTFIQEVQVRLRDMTNTMKGL